MKKVKFENYEEALSAAKEALLESRRNQFVVAEIALRFTDSSKGGDNSAAFTQKDFAIGIGVPPRTLNTWIVAYKKVYSKLTAKQKKETTLTECNKICDMIIGDETNEQVRYLFEEHKKDKSTVVASLEDRLLYYGNNIKSINHFFMNSLFSISSKKEELSEFRYYIDSIRDCLNDYEPEYNDIFRRNSKKLPNRETKDIFQGISGMYKSKNGKRVRIYSDEIKVLNFLKKRRTKIGPTGIYKELKGSSGNGASSWSLRRLIPLMDLGLVSKSDDGKYFYKK